MKLLIAIPTWNRADYLDKAISAISAARSMAQGCEVELFISDNCSSDHTAEVAARWQESAPWIHYRCWDKHTPLWRIILERALKGSDLDYDYLWLQGDDDYVSDPTAFTQIAEALEASAADPPALIHCCQARRALPGDRRIIAGNTEDLCNTYGWHDLLGWISSQVMSRTTVKRMLASPQWEGEGHSAFIHSEVLLEAAYGELMLLLTAGLIDPQDEKQTEECKDRWAKGGGSAAYWFVPQGLLGLKQRGVLRTPLTLGFFRYITYSFWDRFAGELLAKAANPDTSAELLESRLDTLGSFADLLGYGEDRKLYESWFLSFRDEVMEVHHTIRRIHQRILQAKRPSFSFSLLPPSEFRDLGAAP